jgi:hypothetical protein
MQDWKGENEFYESVSSGIYFYSLSIAAKPG